MGGLSAENEARANEHAERIRKLLEGAGYSQVTVETVDLGNRISIVWHLPKPWPEQR